MAKRGKQYRIGSQMGRRTMFVSQEKQAQHQAARRLKLWSRAVLFVVILGVALIVGGVLRFVMIPYFYQEIVTQIHSEGEDAEPVPDYDELGLPIYDNSISLFVINSQNPNPDYVPKLAALENVQVDARIADAMRQLVAAAKEDGLVLIFTDGYVSSEEQGKRYEAMVEEYMDERTAVMAKTEARAKEPMAGESDFQTGLCLRLAADKETFTQSKPYAWLKTNMASYGFVFRYPEGKENYTAVDPDLTVLRYVGGENAAVMQQRSMCLEEYRSYLNDQ